MEVKPIGFIKSDFQQKFGTPRQGSLSPSSRAQLILDKEWRNRGIFSGLEGFSHVWLVSFFHLNETARRFAKVHPPRLRGKKVGVFASRSPHRPNPIGLSLARIVEVSDDTLLLSEIDLVENTPILDIKPYLAEADRPSEYRSGWTEHVSLLPVSCEFSETALAQIESLVASKIIRSRERLESLITEMVSLDPRAPAYLGREEAEFAVWVSGLNVVFSYSVNKFTILKVETINETTVSI